LFSNRIIYKGKKKARPNVFEGTRDLRKSYALDIDIKNILRILPEPSADNNETAFWMDSTSPSYAYMTIYTILGDGFRVKVPKNAIEQKKIIDFNKRINVNGDTIEDFVIDTWLDAVVHKSFSWRVANGIRGIDGEIKVGPDIQRMDPSTLQTEYDDVSGWRRFIQNIQVKKAYDTPNQFLRDEFPNVKTSTTASQIVIPDDQRLIIHCDMFKRAPMDAALPFIVMKYWILTFMRKYGEKMWAPYFLAFVGDPKTNIYPNSEQEMDEALDAVTETLVKLKNFSAGAFPGDTRMEIKEVSGKGQTYIDFVDMCNREIMFALNSSIAARESVGVYKSNQLADEGNVRFMKGIRKKYENILKRFYVMNITTGISEEDIVFMWPEMRSSGINDIANAIEKLSTYGIFKDANERRRAASQIFPFLMETDITKEEMAKMDKQFMDLNKPSQPKEEGGALGKTKGKSAKASDKNKK